MGILKSLFSQRKTQRQFRNLSARISKFNVRAARELPAVEDAIMGVVQTDWAYFVVRRNDSRESLRERISETAREYGLDLKSLAGYLGLALFYERGRDGSFAPFGETKAGSIITVLGIVGEASSADYLEVVLSANTFDAKTRQSGFNYRFSGYYIGVLQNIEIGWSLGQIGGLRAMSILKDGMNEIKSLGWDFPYSFLVGLCQLSDKAAIADLKQMLDSANVTEKCLTTIRVARYFPAFLVPQLEEIVGTTQDYYVGEQAKRIIEMCNTSQLR